MKEVRFWFGWLFLILPLHGVEQLMFGLDELYELQGQVGAVLDLFANRDKGIVVMVFAVVMLVAALVYGGVVGGRWRLLGPAFFGINGLGESHHIIKTIVHADYFPGAVTAVGYVLIGFFLLR